MRTEIGAQVTHRRYQNKCAPPNQNLTSGRRATGVFLISGKACSHSKTAIWHINFQFAAPRFSVPVNIRQPALEAACANCLWAVPASPQRHSIKTYGAYKYTSKKKKRDYAMISILPVPWANSMPGSVSMFGSLWDLPRCRQPSSPSDVAMERQRRNPESNI